MTVSAGTYIIEPIWIESREAAFSLVEQQNKKLQAEAERKRARGWSNDPYSKPKVYAVVAKMSGLPLMLCFNGDDNAQMYVGGAIIDVPERYMLPVSEVAVWVDHAVIHPDLAQKLNQIYGFGFNPKEPSSDDHLFDSECSSEMALGTMLCFILKAGTGTISRGWEQLAFISGIDDKPLQLLKQTASEWMEKNNFDPYS